MNLSDTEKDPKMYGNCGLLPEHDELKDLSDRNYIRLKTESGNLFWALILQRKGSSFNASHIF